MVRARLIRRSGATRGRHGREAPNGEVAKGEGDYLEQAVSDLANQLDKLRGSPNG